jgi:hypothetical protein
MAVIKSIHGGVAILLETGYSIAMTQIEQDLLRTLVELDDAVKTVLTANPKPDLLPIFAKLDGLAAHLPPDADPELKHFLQRKSYGKARARLEGRAAARGSCVH